MLCARARRKRRHRNHPDQKRQFVRRGSGLLERKRGNDAETPRRRDKKSAERKKRFLHADHEYGQELFRALFPCADPDRQKYGHIQAVRMGQGERRFPDRILHLCERSEIRQFLHGACNCNRQRGVGEKGLHHSCIQTER